MAKRTFKQYINGQQKAVKLVNDKPGLAEPDMAYTVEELFWKMAKGEDLSDLQRKAQFPTDVSHDIEDYEKLLGLDLVDELEIKRMVDGKIEQAKLRLAEMQEQHKQAGQNVAYRDKDGNLITQEQWLEQNPPPPTDPAPTN